MSDQSLWYQEAQREEDRLRLQLCPRKYCFNFLGKESPFEGEEPPTAVPLPYKEEPVTLAQCGLNTPFGRCRRLSPTNERDFYNPCTPVLKRDGIAEDYFVNPEESPY